MFYAAQIQLLVFLHDVLSSYVTSLLRETKATNYNNLISGISDSKQLWNTINTAIGRKNAINPITGLSSLQLDESSPIP